MSLAQPSEPTATQLRQRLDEIEAQRAHVKTEKQREVMMADTDEQAQLTQQLDAVLTSIATMQQDISTTQNHIRELPSEKTLLKLERRLEVLKHSLAETQKTNTQLSAGINAYVERTRGCTAAERSLCDSLAAALSSVVPDTVTQTAKDESVPPASKILTAIDQLLHMYDDREAELISLIQGCSVKFDEEHSLAVRMTQLRNTHDSDLPRIETEAEQATRRITAAWASEKQALTQLYDRLYAVNKEQQHHLQRGTHVKPPPPSTARLREQGLTSRHAQLSARLVEARERLKEIDADNAFTKRTTDQLRAEGREYVEQFETVRAEVAAKLQQARAERANTEEESRRFLRLRAELQDALHAIRDTAKYTPTPTTAAPATDEHLPIPS